MVVQDWKGRRWLRCLPGASSLDACISGCAVAVACWLCCPGRQVPGHLLLLPGIGNLPAPVCFMGVVCCCQLFLVMEPGVCVPAQHASTKAYPQSKLLVTYLLIN